ncbi:hypothetical protein PG996_000684 [Apiospora saccharicola]|uniref:Uncharacterized protein n=1 Tax=Apiospora saccharicola TaxID=335842 RepID=A0ABR1WIJ1_9PEZI
MSGASAFDKNTEPYVTPGKRLRNLMSQDGICVQAPGVYDGICARVAIEQGFQVMVHLPIRRHDDGRTPGPRGPGLRLAHGLCAERADDGEPGPDPRVPLVADADTGFGGPPNIARMVQVYHQSGVAGFHIEDQVANKRCRHLKGKAEVDMETWKSRIRACVIGRESIYGGSDIVIIARTDAMAIEGYDAALERLVAARECGADMGFLEAIETEEQIENAVKVLAPMPLMINFVSRGKMPWFPVESLGEWGVKLAIYPGQAAKSVLHTIREAYQFLRETGGDHAEAKGLDPRGFFDIMGLEGEMEIDRRAGGADFANGA